jgi:hypothetical protein
MAIKKGPEKEYPRAVYKSTTNMEEFYHKITRITML